MPDPNNQSISFFNEDNPISKCKKTELLRGLKKFLIFYNDQKEPNKLTSPNDVCIYYQQTRLGSSGCFRDPADQAQATLVLTELDRS